MPGRDPEAQSRSARVADEVRAAMAVKGITNAGLADLLRKAGVDVPDNDMWISRRLTGAVNLVVPVKVVYGPTDELVKIATVLDLDPAKLVKVLNAGNPRQRKASTPAPNAAE